LDDLLKKYTNEAIKFALLQTNYRNDINITDTLFPEAEKHLTEFYKVIQAVEQKYGKGGKGNKEIDEQFDKCMDDDFNTALALSDLFGYFKNISKKFAAGDASCCEDVCQIRRTYSLLGLFKKDADEYLKEVASKNVSEIPEEVTTLASQRWQAKKDKNWALADQLRAKIDTLGYSVKDSKDGYEIIKK
jgi:cysteinyl-tRNA synthetase